jgi:hypothetical protein
LVDAARSEISKAAQVSDRKGRHSNTPHKRHQRDIIDYMRWDAVTELHTREGDLIIPPPGRPSERRRIGDEYGTSWLKHYRAASKILAGSIAAGGPGAVKQSYGRVQRNLKSGRGGRYFLG